MLAEHPGALILGGGTDLMVEINDGHRRPDGFVISVGRIADLRSWRHDPSARRADARRRRSPTPSCSANRSPSLVPALAQASRTVGSPQIRNAGTLGRQPRYVLARRRRAAGPRRPRGDRHADVGHRCPVVARRRVHGRRQAHRHPTGRDDRRDRHPDPRRLAGVREGRRAQRDGDRRGQCLRRRRPRPAPRGARPRIGRSRRCCAARTPRTSSPVAIDWSTMTAPADALDRFGALASDASRPIDDHRSTAAYRRHAVGVLASRLARRAVGS